MPLSVPPRHKGSMKPSLETPPAPLTLRVSSHSAGQRLDDVLKTLLPGLGLRARRRLWDWCRISVNGRGQKPGYIVSSGDEVRLESSRNSPQNPQEHLPAVSLLALNHDYAAFGKPEGLHSAQIAGSRTPSLEGMLRTAWPEIWRRWMAGKATPAGGSAGATPPPEPWLLTRLDKATSGLLLGARHVKAADNFRLCERQGLVKKTYFAVIRGELERTLYLTWRLNTAKRALTLVTDEDDPDPARHTSVVPVSIVDTCLIMGGKKTIGEISAKSTLVRVLIKRGARHQIRAHLSRAGFPLLGEWLYAPAHKDAGRLFLHHARMEFPGFTAEQRPGWFYEPGFNFLCEAGGRAHPPVIWP